MINNLPNPYNIHLNNSKFSLWVGNSIVGSFLWWRLERLCINLSAVRVIV